MLRKKGIYIKYINDKTDMYLGVITSIKTEVRDTQEFLITVSLHLGAALSMYLFTLVMHELITTIQDEVPCCMLFVKIVC